MRIPPDPEKNAPRSSAAPHPATRPLGERSPHVRPVSTAPTATPAAPERRGRPTSSAVVPALADPLCVAFNLGALTGVGGSTLVQVRASLSNAGYSGDSWRDGVSRAIASSEWASRMLRTRGATGAIDRADLTGLVAAIEGWAAANPAPTARARKPTSP